ncbi:MAG: IS630 family transposase [Actinomycetota bacterium]
MPRRSPYVIELSEEERGALERLAAKYSSPYRDVVRAKIVLYAAQGLSNEEIANPWTFPGRWCPSGAGASTRRGSRGLPSGPAGAGPPSFPPQVVVEVKALACELPARLGVPLSRLQVPDIRPEAIARGIVAEVSGSTIWRWLTEDAIRPWAHRSWIFPRDPEFERKAGRVLDLYAGCWEGKPLRRGEFVLLADEKTSIQARLRRRPTLPPAAARAMRVEHEYRRGGALAYLAAWDCHRGKVFGRCEPKTGIAPFDRLVDEVMRKEPYRSARRVFWVVDNGSSHRGQASIDRLEGAYENVRLIHLPKHASWLNQIEIYFSVVQRKVLTPNDFTDLAEVEERLLAFQARYEEVAKPFEWKFTRQDLAYLMARLSCADERFPAAA